MRVGGEQNRFGFEVVVLCCAVALVPFLESCVVTWLLVPVAAVSVDWLIDCLIYCVGLFVVLVCLFC